MREYMTLIEQANIFNKTNHQSLFFERISPKKSFDVYSSTHLIPTTKQTKLHRSDKSILPSIDKDENRPRRKTRRPPYRTSIYHSKSMNFSQIDRPSFTARGTKPESTITTIRDDDTVMNLQRHHAPPPSPSDDHIEQILSELNRTRQSTPRSSTEKNDDIPYRLPALNQTTRRRHAELNIPHKDITSTLSSYLQKYY